LLKFNPLTDEEAAAAETGKPWRDGWYAGCLINVINAVSKNNREMLDVTLRVTGPNDEVREIRDFVHTAMPKKFKEFCIACGLESQYAAGAVDATDIQPDIQIKISLTVERRRGFRPRNTVAGYAPVAAAEVVPPLRVIGARP
jgi:hypothetical protein